MEKQVSVIPVAGLCNRLRTLISGINIAKHLNAQCTIYWNKTNDCYCKFSDLFEDLKLPKVNVLENKTLTHSLGSRKKFFLPTLLQMLKYDMCMYYFAWNDGKVNIFDYIGTQANKILLISCFEMFSLDGLSRNGFQILIPKEKLKKCITKITQKFDRHTIGIHIRGTDNIFSKTYSPLYLFENHIDNLLVGNPDLRFYLSTDEYDIKKKFCDKYGDKIITLPLVLNRTSIEGMEGALVDLYCLSYTDYIIGSDYSSFSEMAAMIGDIKLQILSTTINNAVPTHETIFNIPFTNKTIYKRAIL